MKRGKRTLLISVLFIIIGLGTNLQAQTVVQWYTSMGDFRAQLRDDLAPNTAQNFIDLSNDNFYDDLVFHRVISGFMIQDGCPLGTGYGGPGYTFDDEFHPDLVHDEPGILSMANSGPNSNGSQYFITVAATTWLDGAHAVFGKIIDGMDIVYAISEVETNSSDRPLIDVEIDSIRVVTGTPEIEVTAPAAGVYWNNAIDNTITWESSFVADVKIEFSSDNGGSWTDIIASTSANTRAYVWDAPEVTSDQCLIKVSDVANPEVFNITEQNFTMSQLDLTSPVGFETYRVGTPMEILWNSEFVGDLRVAYQLEEDGEWITIEEDVPSDVQPYIWSPVEASNWLKVKLSDMEYPEVADQSGFKSFVIRLDLLSPAGGELLDGADEHHIIWDSEIGTNVKIEFSSDNGTSWETVENSVSADDEAFLWTLPNITSSDCFIRLSPPSQAELFSTNITAFSITETQGISEGLAKLEMNLSPNPAQNILNVNIDKLNYNDIQSIEIFNTNGALVLTHNLTNGNIDDQKIKVNIETLQNGLYLVKLNNNSQNIIKSFVKTGK